MNDETCEAIRPGDAEHWQTHKSLLSAACRLSGPVVGRWASDQEDFLLRVPPGKAVKHYQDAKATIFKTSRRSADTAQVDCIVSEAATPQVVPRFSKALTTNPHIANFVGSCTSVV